MDIFVMTQLNQITSEQLQSIYALLPENRQEKVQRLRSHNRKLQSAVAYMLLVHALRQRNELVHLPVLIGEGKPVIADRNDLHFSISHCKLGAAAVVNHTPVGIDIEEIRPYNPKVARYVCSDSEVQQIEASDDPALAFTVMWTRKESCIKLFGGSVGPGMKHLDTLIDKLEFETKIGDGWVVTACCEK